MEVNLQAPVSTLFTNTSNTIGDITSNTLTSGSYTTDGSNAISVNAYNGFYWHYWEPYNQYYHSCYHTATSPDKFEVAFKLSRKLMDKKLVKPQKTVEDFFKLMDAIVEVL